MNVTVTFRVLNAEETDKHICLRAIVCKDVTIDLIVELPSIFYYNGDGPIPGVHAHHLTTERDFITEFRQQWVLLHKAYSVNTDTLFHHIQAAADTHSVPTYENEGERISTLQHQHMSDLLHHDENAVESD